MERRYRNLKLRESLSLIYRYPFACKELGFILRNAFSEFPKSLQTTVYQDTLFAFSLLPQVQTVAAISAANCLLRSAEASLPKQKKASVVAEYKHAVIAWKRRSKAQQEAEGLNPFPRDVLLHIFGFLDLQSLVSAAAVCRSWNLAGTDNYLWKLLYNSLFGDIRLSSKQNGAIGQHGMSKNEVAYIDSGTSVDWKDALKKAYKEVSCKKGDSCRGYCWNCCSTVWLSSNICSNKHLTMDSNEHQIKPISKYQIVDYILEDSLSSESSSDSDSDGDMDGIPTYKLWAPILCNRPHM